MSQKKFQVVVHATLLLTTFSQQIQNIQSTLNVSEYGTFFKLLYFFHLMNLYLYTCPFCVYVCLCMKEGACVFECRCLQRPKVFTGSPWSQLVVHCELPNLIIQTKLLSSIRALCTLTWWAISPSPIIFTWISTEKLWPNGGHLNRTSRMLISLLNTKI